MPDGSGTINDVGIMADNSGIQNFMDATKSKEKTIQQKLQGIWSNAVEPFAQIGIVNMTGSEKVGIGVNLDENINKAAEFGGDVFKDNRDFSLGKI